MLLVFMQTGKVEPLGNFNAWKRKGRKGSSAVPARRCSQPSQPVWRDEEGNVVRDENGKAVIAFVSFTPKATVFQLHQTEGPDLVYPGSFPGWDKDQALANLDIEQVPFTDGDGNTQGYATGNKLAMNPVAAHPLPTMLHEMAHIVPGHTAKDKAADYAAHRASWSFRPRPWRSLVGQGASRSRPTRPSRAATSSTGWGTARATTAWDDESEDSVLVEDSTITAIFNAVDKILVAGRKAATRRSRRPGGQ